TVPACVSPPGGVLWSPRHRQVHARGMLLAHVAADELDDGPRWRSAVQPVRQDAEAHRGQGQAKPSWRTGAFPQGLSGACLRREIGRRVGYPHPFGGANPQPLEIKDVAEALPQPLRGGATEGGASEVEEGQPAEVGRGNEGIDTCTLDAVAKQRQMME